MATSPDIRVVVETLVFLFFLVFLVFWFAPVKEEVASQSANLRRTKHCEDDNFAVRVRRLRSSGWLEDFVVRVRQQTADIGCLVYQMIRPTHTGCCERKKHETIHSIKAIYLQNFVFFSAHNTPFCIYIIYTHIQQWHQRCDLGWSHQFFQHGEDMRGLSLDRAPEFTA